MFKVSRHCSSTPVLEHGAKSKSHFDLAGGKFQEWNFSRPP